jgi:hypothetical protein
MSKIRIGTNERALGDATESWINQQINQRRDDGHTVCVQVFLDEGGVNLVLSTPTCTSSGGGGRPPTAHEREIFDLWSRHHLDQNRFTGGNVIAFLKQLPNVPLIRQKPTNGTTAGRFCSSSNQQA